MGFKLKLVAVLLSLLSFITLSAVSYSDLAYEILGSYSQELKMQGFSSCGIGGSFMGEVKMLSLDVTAQKKVNLEEARLIYVQAVENFVRKINLNKQMRPFLSTYPATERIIELSIDFREGYEDVPAPFIAYVILIDGVIHYSIVDSKTGQYQRVLKEPYQEALKIVYSSNYERNNLEAMLKAPIKKIPSFSIKNEKYTGPKFAINTGKSRDVFADQFAKKNDLVFLSNGLGNFAEAKKSFWGINLMSNKALSIEEARKLAQKLTYQFLYRMYNDPCFAEHCKIKAEQYSTYKAWQGHEWTTPEVKEEYIAFRLAFWDENMNRPLPPYIAQIRLADGNLYYHYADPRTQALQEPIVESIESLQLPNYKKQ